MFGNGRYLPTLANGIYSYSLVKLYMTFTMGKYSNMLGSVHLFTAVLQKLNPTQTLIQVRVIQPEVSHFMESTCLLEVLVVWRRK